ncbi:MAG TPA: sensor histidine kinase [Acidimicrobiales bacterium]|nr:sensor histidine kinase [Acidimicrobiales bacterium]
MTMTAAPCTFDHDAFVYDSDDGYVEALAPSIGAALQDGRPVVAVVDERHASLLRAALGPSAQDVSWVDAVDWYRRPARTIAGYDRTLRSTPRGAFVIGEVQFGSTPHEWAEWTRYEAVLNRVFAHYEAHVVCPYDARVLPGSVVADAERTHPHMFGRTGRCPSEHYIEPEALFAAFGPVIAVPGRDPDFVMVDPPSLRAARHFFADVAARAGLAWDNVQELSVGVSEVLTNARLHGAGAAVMRVWVDDRLVCVIDDQGIGTDDPLLGLRVPAPTGEGGFGLWYTRQVFDHVDIAAAPEGGTRVVLASDLPVGARA